jgi:hypothetical protein
MKCDSGARAGHPINLLVRQFSMVDKNWPHGAHQVLRPECLGPAFRTSNHACSNGFGLVSQQPSIQELLVSWACKPVIALRFG